MSFYSRKVPITSKDEMHSVMEGKIFFDKSENEKIINKSYNIGGGDKLFIVTLCSCMTKNIGKDYVAWCEIAVNFLIFPSITF